jgi:class 3 adenylate cyclase
VELPGDDHFFFLGDRRGLVAVIEEFLHGQPVPSVPDGRLVAAVLVDIVESTRRATEEGRAGWQVVLARHEDAVRDEVAHHDGRVVNTAGDSFLVLFDSAACAVRFAAAAQRRSAEVELAVRVGVHVGEVDERDGGAAGLALHVVARVQALAEPGEVLVTGTVRDALLGADLVFVPRGRRGLRGLPGRWSLYRIGTA